jgi:outer membrane protein assembly factor BamD
MTGKGFYRAFKGTSASVLLFALVAAVALAGCSYLKTLNDSTVVSTNVEELFERAVHDFQTNRYEEAEAELKRVIEDYPLTRQSLDAELILADLYFEIERFEEASSYYASFVTLHPAHPKAEYALFQKGMSNFKQVLSVDRDQKATRQSLFAFEDLLKSYPHGSYVEKSREMIGFLKERLAEREFYVGKYYYNGGNYRGALGRFKEILEFYRETTIVDKALYYVAKSYEHLGEDELAKEAYATIEAEFPKSPYAKGAAKKLDKKKYDG